MGKRRNWTSTDSFRPSRMKKQGEYVIEIGNRLRRKVNVDAATVHPDCVPWPEPDEPRIPIALPQGHWTVVGAKPRECHAIRVGQTGELVRPAFKAEWAIRVGARRGATAIHLHDPYNAPTGKETFGEETEIASTASARGNCRQEGRNHLPSWDPQARSAVRARMFDRGTRRRVA